MLLLTLLVGRHLGQLYLALMYLRLLAAWRSLGSTPRDGRKMGVTGGVAEDCKS